MLPLPVPASVYGLVLLLAALNFKLVKLEDVKEPTSPVFSRCCSCLPLQA